MEFNITSIILAITTLLGACGWFVKGRMHKRETESIEADNKKKELELAVEYIEQFKNNIVIPLQDELKTLKNELNTLQQAIYKINECDYGFDCPVRDELLNKKDAQQG